MKQWGREMMGVGNEMAEACYNASIFVIKDVLPFVPRSDGMAERLEKTVKEIPRLIAGTGTSAPDNEQCVSAAAKNCREAVVMLSYCRDLHGQFINKDLCADIIETYRRVGRLLGERTPNEADKKKGEL